MQDYVIDSFTPICWERQTCLHRQQNLRGGSRCCESTTLLCYLNPTSFHCISITWLCWSNASYCVTANPYPLGHFNSVQCRNQPIALQDEKQLSDAFSLRCCKRPRPWSCFVFLLSLTLSSSCIQLIAHQPGSTYRCSCSKNTPVLPCRCRIHLH